MHARAATWASCGSAALDLQKSVSGYRRRITQNEGGTGAAVELEGRLNPNRSIRAHNQISTTRVAKITLFGNFRY
jgi:hypothetical protein